MSRIKYILLIILGLLLICPVVVNANSIEIKMDLTYKYKKDNFRVIYIDDNNEEYDVTSKSEIDIEEIDTGDGIVRKVDATYDGLNDTVHEYTYNFEGNSTFSSAFENMKKVNEYLIAKSNRTIVVDIFNVKIKKDTYYDDSAIIKFGYAPTHGAHVVREVNFIGCNSEFSDYDMPIFDGRNQTHQLLLVGHNNFDHPYNDRTVNFYNFQVQNYENGIILQFQDNSIIKGMIFKDLTDSDFNGTGQTGNRPEGALGINYISNGTFVDNEFRDLYGDGSVDHAFYLAHNSDNNLIRNNFIINTNINALALRDNVTNTIFEKNYLFNSGSVGKSGGEKDKGVQYVGTNTHSNEEHCLYNEFRGNKIRESRDINHIAVSISLDKYGHTYYYPFNNKEGEIFNYSYHCECGVDIEDLDEFIRVNSCEERNSIEISSEEFKPVRNVIKHIDKEGNSLRANDVIITNKGNTFTANAKMELIGVDGSKIYTKDYKAKLYDSNNKEITKDINGNSIVDDDGYIKTNNIDVVLKALEDGNQTYTFVYGKPAVLKINYIDEENSIISTETRNLTYGDSYNLKTITDLFLSSNRLYELNGNVENQEIEINEDRVEITIRCKKTINNGGEQGTATAGESNTSEEKNNTGNVINNNLNNQIAENEGNISTPKTGDNIIVWIAIMIVAAVGTIGTAKFLRKGD